ncbi:MAG: cytochrome C [Confluentimicrobium sp.]|uniref:cytochrome-c peroxidase n=1 Tax=Actibacterium sp. TaxID=1872125 RepID=UPI00068F3319|nr:cytochrome c peroxidase [Actibacterium sp.]MBC55771.1 cytochrome C [Actibacterium sp.]MDY6860149.1 cytochrome c peroxidase [Pseudomonadota bacterium]|tara:strand:+ start:270 stop:1562 length:1293 start_codon:yes stop_codon:yes gene_type:complete
MKIYALPITATVALLSAPVSAAELTPMEQLGRDLFFDADLSLNGNQPCAFCHDPGMGFSSPHGHFNESGAVVEGSVPGLFGSRKPPSAAYASPAPVFHHTIEDGDYLFVGGAFVDGRATGHQLGNAAADQAMGPPLNPVEMAMPHQACVVRAVCEGEKEDKYAVSLSDVWGAGICDIAFPAALAESCGTPGADIVVEDEELAEKIETAFAMIGLSLGAFEASAEVNRFSSRYDRYLSGTDTLSALELQGLELFEGKALCAECHVTSPGPRGEPALLTDFTYDNLGVPRNPENPIYTQPDNPDGLAFADLGLGVFLRSDPLYRTVAASQDGKFKVPTLRNVDARLYPEMPKAFMHNGYFKTLEGVVKFYNKRDVWPRCDSDMVTEAEALEKQCWPGPEVAANVNADELGDLKLTDAEELALVAFMQTLTDE